MLFLTTQKNNLTELPNYPVRKMKDVTVTMPERQPRAEWD